MTKVSEWNAGVVKEFRDNDGRLGGDFEGAPVTLLHHIGRSSGDEYIAPVMYLPDDSDDSVIYVFASKAGAPEHPDWYYNLLASGRGVAEVGTEARAVTVTEVTGEERDRVYAEQVRRYPGFGEYAEKTAGIRTIPVLALRRA